MGWVVDIDEHGLTVVELAEADADVPRHHGELWIEGNELNLSFDAIENIDASGRTPLRIDAHAISFPADLNGITAAEDILLTRQRLMQKGNEHLLMSFAAKADDRSKILAMYAWMLEHPAMK
ncbi:MAG TPA: hypothetical protein VKX28_16240 [Xanthobacteraceae bacterium]|nr:hypothetical protein [Xanthobacteraceae bacterium]